MVLILNASSPTIINHWNIQSPINNTINLYSYKIKLEPNIGFTIIDLAT